MAEVFLARLPGLAGFQKTLVIKRILPHLSRKKHFVDLFVAEATLAAQVRHRNAVQVFELGQVDGELYMAMEYVDGNDVRRLLRYAARENLRIPPWFAVHVLCEVLEALAYAYELQDDDGRQRKVVHRDVTPSNIFISNQGEVKLGDFGVAKDDTREQQTRAGQLKGKVAYMAPEQLHGQAIDQRTDLFAAGVVLWECLAQRRLFGGRPDIEAMNAICVGARPRPSDYLRDVPVALDAVVLKALQPDPALRFQSAMEFQRALYAVQETLRPRVTPSDLRVVQRALTKEVTPEEAGLSGLGRLRTRTGSGDSVPSFTGLSAGEDSSNRSNAPVLANPAYTGPTDSVAELSVDVVLSSQDLRLFQELASDLGPAAGRPPEREVSSRGGLQPLDRAPGHAPLPRAPSGVLAGRPLAPPPRSPSGAGLAAPTPARSGSVPGAPRVPVDTGYSYAAAPRVPSVAPSVSRSTSSHPGLHPLGVPLVQGQPAAAAPGPTPVLRGTPAWVPPPAGAPPPPPPAFAPPPRAPGPAQDDFDMDAVVMAAVESVQRERPAVPKVEQSSLIAGLDSRRLVGETRASRSERWAFVLDRELYEGPHPFFVVDHEGSEIGPCSYEQALKIVKLEAKAGHAERARIGVEPGNYIPARMMLELMGMQTLVRPELPEPPAMLESEGRSPIRIFADYTRHPISGRLLLFRDRGIRSDYREIELLGGEPTFVWTEEESLQYPTMLVSKKILRAQAIGELAHMTVAARRPLELIVSKRLGTDLSRYRPMLMKERLVDAFSRGFAAYSVVERTELVHTESFAPNLLQVALELTFRCIPKVLIEGHVAARIKRKLKVARDFDRLLGELSLTPDLVQAASLLTKGRPIDRLLETYPELRRTLVSLAFFCFEADLISIDL
jgi:serine/threonine protein kinase